MKCLIVDDDDLSRLIMESFIGQTDFLHLSGSFSNPVEAAQALRNGSYDLMFLDVEMPEMTGFDLLNNLEDPPLIILVSGKDEYALEAFEYEVTDYLLKPVNYARFLKAATKARRQLQEKWEKQSLTELPDTADYIFLKSDSRFVKVPFSDIIMVESMGDYVVFNTDSKKHMVYARMNAMEKRLPESQFSRVHRSFIVNHNRIKAIEESLIIIDDKLVPIGSSYKSELFRKLRIC